MIVVMKQGATKEQVEHMIRRVEELGLKSHVIHGTERTVIAAIGDKRDEYRQSLESGPGVGKVVPYPGALQGGQAPRLKSEPSSPAVRSGSAIVISA